MSKPSELDTIRYTARHQGSRCGRAYCQENVAKAGAKDSGRGRGRRPGCGSHRPAPGLCRHLRLRADRPLQRMPGIRMPIRLLPMQVRYRFGRASALLQLQEAVDITMLQHHNLFLRLLRMCVAIGAVGRVHRPRTWPRVRDLLRLPQGKQWDKLRQLVHVPGRLHLLQVHDPAAGPHGGEADPGNCAGSGRASPDRNISNLSILSVQRLLQVASKPSARGLLCRHPEFSCQRQPLWQGLR